MNDRTRPNWIEDHIRRYTESNGEDGHIWNGMPTLLLKTVGRRSGVERLVPLIYGKVDGNYVIVGSKGGAPQHPSWYLNLVENPKVAIQVGSKHMSGVARISAGSERSDLWNTMCDVFSGYTEYQQKTDRQIPIVVIEPD